VRSASQRLGGESSADSDLWTRIREHQHPFFRDASSLWRISVPPATGPLDLDGATLVEWNGGLRWLATDAPAQVVRNAAAAAGGHAVWFRGHDGKDVFHPMDSARLALHRSLKRAFDPAGILNPGRMYAGL
jgi:glycolate oxidase FAD binding subunit